jgi:hypothetical protein
MIPEEPTKTQPPASPTAPPRTTEQLALFALGPPERGCKACGGHYLRREGRFLHCPRCGQAYLSMADAIAWAREEG